VTFSPGVLNNMPATYIGTVQLNQSKEEDLQRSLANAFPNVTSIRVKDALDTANKILKNVAQAIRLSALVAFIAGILVLAGGIATGNRRRVYDSVILKVIGLTRGRIFGGFMLEYLLLGLITAFIAGVLGTITAWFLQTKMMGMDWVFDLQAVLMTSIICLVITLLFGWVGTWRVLGNKPAPMLRND